MPTKWQRFSVDLSGYSPEEREAIAVRIIDQIKERTRDGKDKNGKPFAGYSKSYKESQNFKIAGKGNSVDLTLTGDMLDSIQILSSSRGKVVIGFENGTTENGKADGNIRGTYGQSSPVGPKRDFLGVSKRELRSILEQFPVGSERSKKEARKTLMAVENADILSGNVDVDELDDG